MRLVFTVFALLNSFFGMFGALVLLVPYALVPAVEAESFFGVVLVAAGIVLAAFSAGLVTWVAASVLWLRAMRDPSAVGWVPPSRCANLSHWLFTRWSYVSNGRQEGVRILGLELVFEGTRTS